jgi:hypothetical protein
MIVSTNAQDFEILGFLTSIANADGLLCSCPAGAGSVVRTHLCVTTTRLTSGSHAQTYHGRQMDGQRGMMSREKRTCSNLLSTSLSWSSMLGFILEDVGTFSYEA